jgi:putative CocE/NonD family hydrolase
VAPYRRGVTVSALAGRLLKLSPPLTREIRVRRGIGVRARDGVILRTDHYAPAGLDAPTILVRTPYGRGGINILAARLFAERGFHVVVSSCRGTAGSGGSFDPLWHERDDGLDTVDWLRRQPWFSGRLGTFGPSYVGYTQWAIADVPELAAMATVVTASQFRDPTYAGDSFALFTTLAWATLLQAQRVPRLGNTIDMLRGNPRLKRAFAHLPLGEADLLATGEEVAFFRRWLSLAGASTEEVDAYWSVINHDHRLPTVSAPVLMVGGWQDIFLPWQLRDYAALRAVGARPQLTIGPWTHGSGGLLVESLRESIDWMRTHLRGEPGRRRRRPVRLYVSGADEWREYDDWPPAPMTPHHWYLHGGGRLAEAGPAPSTPDRFVYDPADPTPAVAGPVLLANVSKPRDNSELEARADVLVYTGDVLRADLDVIGPVTASVYVRGSRPFFDVFVRLCDVDPAGRSMNVCDGLARVRPDRYPDAGDGVSAVEVELWPTAYRFRAGHRLRVQVSAGAHPRYPRNPGTGDPLASAVDLHPVTIEVLHEPDRASRLVVSTP